MKKLFALAVSAGLLTGCICPPQHGGEGPGQSQGGGQPSFAQQGQGGPSQGERGNPPNMNMQGQQQGGPSQGERGNPPNMNAQGQQGEQGKGRTSKMKKRPYMQGQGQANQQSQFNQDAQ